MPWQVATASDSYRPATEDRLGAWPTTYGYLLAVADGMGGRPGGAAAAEFALGGIGAYVRWPDFPGPNALADLLRRIDLDAAGGRDVGETTAATCCVSERGLSGAAVGDSAAWWVTADAVTHLADQAWPKPWIGSGSARPFPFSAPPETGTLLLMTDGVWKYADPTVLAGIARGDDLPSIPRRLIDAARMRSGQLQDDAAVIAARLTPADT